MLPPRRSTGPTGWDNVTVVGGRLRRCWSYRTSATRFGWWHRDRRIRNWVNIWAARTKVQIRVKIAYSSSMFGWKMRLTKPILGLLYGYWSGSSTWIFQWPPENGAMKTQYLKIVLLSGGHTLFGAFEMDVKFLPSIVTIVNMRFIGDETIGGWGNGQNIHYKEEILVCKPNNGNN